ncbi:uncharacterized protein SPSK_01572 [Sporothrix schenckii 1099-18]|uniref:Uncharacterized protein n=1 Tax=Sporothrix schenckii 1099-18 TaxID=1397361 RepID=A0A0F2MGI1_SPOSC|nr:uncharacterized protein SPSK_01572 [Sporothrix schenckii 1099-18]KJR87276.1 hypothetical protein SPSK_01572 [Sporothrix schenckii 1099-18]
MPNTTASAGPAAATAATVSWLHAYPPLLILASAAMAQPAGRLLSVGAISSVWLRVSPILCALDALSVVARCLVYCVLLRATPWQALVLIGTDRFADDAGTTVAAAASATERGTTSRIAAVAKAATTTAIRLAGFALGVVPLVELIWFEPGGHEARWTAAWGWLYVGSYVFLEAAAAVYRWEQAQPQYTAADFELDEVEADDVAQEAAAVTAGSGTDGVPYDGVPSRDSDETRRASQEGTVVGDDDERNDNDDDDDDDDNPVDDAETADLLIRGGDRSDTAAVAAPAAASATPADVEAAKPHPYEYNNDPSSHPRLPGIHTAFAKGESYAIALGVLAHAVIVYWIFLDLIQPPINAHILQVDNTTSEGWQLVSGWAVPLYYLGLPFTFAAMLVIMAVTLGGGALVVIALLSIAKAINDQLPASVTGWARGLVPAAITVGMAGLGGLATVVSFFMGSPALGNLLLSPHMMWIYSMLSVEIVLLVLYLFASFLLYVVVRQCAIAFKTKYGVPRSATDQEPAPASASPFDRGLSRATAVFHAPADDAPRWAAGLLPYTTDDSAGLLAMALQTFVLSLVWYAVRFAVSGHWAQHWADALVANITMVHNGTNGTNGTTNATFSVSSVVVSSTPVSTPVQLF